MDGVLVGNELVVDLPWASTGLSRLDIARFFSRWNQIVCNRWRVNRWQVMCLDEFGKHMDRHKHKQWYWDGPINCHISKWEHIGICRILP